MTGLGQPRTGKLTWLPTRPDVAAAMHAASREGVSWDALVSLARHDLDAILTDRLARARETLFPDGGAIPAGTAPVRLLLLGTPTLTQLMGGIVVGALRRGVHATVSAGEFGQYRASLLPDDAASVRWKPTHVLFAFDARFATGRLWEADDAADPAASFVDHVTAAWSEARRRFGGAVSVLQALVLPVLPRLLGSAERRFGGSGAARIERINVLLAARAEAAGVLLVDPASVSAGQDPSTWYDPVPWFTARQEVSPTAAPLFGDLVGRVLGAERGRSAKCLVLDLDDTLWGGTIGEDGLHGIVLGPGSPAGEAFVALQEHALALSRRGVVLAVCSKNDAAVAALPFDGHPEMRLQRADLAAFVANWHDKASNLRAIASMLNLGLDALVFVDDNPFERNQVRDALPTVWVPEVPDDPALVPACLADGGFFEALAVTGDDRARGARYAANAARAVAATRTNDIGAFLAGLRMVLEWRPFRPVDLERIAQLVNKTNQCNLTTRRRGAAELAALAANPDWICLSFRLRDAFGDNGLVAVAMARVAPDASTATVDTWLMSCRVLGRGVEAAIFAVLLSASRARGVRALVGEYVPSARNAMVRGHYASLGFDASSCDPDTGAGFAFLPLDGAAAPTHHITIEDGERT